MPKKTTLPTTQSNVFDFPKSKSKTLQKIKYPCGCEAIGPAPMPASCPTHTAFVTGMSIADKKQEVYVSLILDESGSMESCRQQTIDGFNTYIDTLSKDDKALYYLHLTKFDSFGSEPTCRGVFSVQLGAPKPGSTFHHGCHLTKENYAPRGGTPMYDAIGQTVTQIGDKADKYIVVILTDGEENSSREHTKDSVKKIIAEKEALGNWTFVYLGANQNAWAEASKMGFASGNVANFATAHTANVMSCFAADTVSYAASNLMGTADFLRCSTSTTGAAGAFVYGVPTPSTLGSLGGKARTSTMTPEQRKEAARHAAQARWNKSK